MEEEFPFAYTAVVPEGMEREDVEMVMAGMAMVDDATLAESMPGSSDIDAGAMMAAGESITAMKVDEVAALSGALAAAMSGESPEPEQMQKVAGMMEPVMMAMADPQGGVSAVKQGQFRDADSFHRGSGDATIFATPGGNHLLRLEDLNVTNGPALHVLLATHPDPADSGDVKSDGYVDLGPLKGNRGNQNYPIPADVDVSAANSVIIYCKPFSVVFSVAPLAAS
ncbi:MAG: DM13 domain-containing protein [Chloroflexota bacterium]|nr:DM13 domain-containing protein [Chloroflexota bacterium]